MGSSYECGVCVLWYLSTGRPGLCHLYIHSFLCSVGSGAGEEAGGWKGLSNSKWGRSSGKAAPWVEAEGRAEGGRNRDQTPVSLCFQTLCQGVPAFCKQWNSVWMLGEVITHFLWIPGYSQRVFPWICPPQDSLTCVSCLGVKTFLFLYLGQKTVMCCFPPSLQKKKKAVLAVFHLAVWWLKVLISHCLTLLTCNIWEI